MALIGAWHTAVFSVTGSWGGEIPDLAELLGRLGRKPRKKASSQLPFEAEIARWERFFHTTAAADRR